MEEEQGGGGGGGQFVSFFKESEEVGSAVSRLITLQSSVASRLSKAKKDNDTGGGREGVEAAAAAAGEKDEEGEGEERESRQLCERVEQIMELYQEQPHLLDPHLEGLISPLLAAVRSIRDVTAPPVRAPSALPRAVPDLQGAGSQDGGAAVLPRGQ